MDWDKLPPRLRESLKNDPITESVRRDAEFYRKNPRSLSSWGYDYGSAQPQGVEEQYQAAAREKRMRESGVPE